MISVAQRSPARLGKAGQGKARRGAAGRGWAWQGWAWQGWAWQGEAGQGFSCWPLSCSKSGETMKTVSVEIRGTSPLLIHRFSEDAEQSAKTRATLTATTTPREEAEKHAYVAADGTFYMSAFAIPNAMGAAGAAHKMRGSRKSLRFVVPSAVRMKVDALTIMNGRGPATDFEVDSRPVTIPATKGRIMRHRPRFDQWGLKFDLLVDDSLIEIDIAHRLLNEAGTSIGIGDFRPEKRGPFGCFVVTRFDREQ